MEAARQQFAARIDTRGHVLRAGQVKRYEKNSNYVSVLHLLDIFLRSVSLLFVQIGTGDVLNIIK